MARPLSDIHVPDPQPDLDYAFRDHGRSITFRGLKALLGAADIHKAGDARAGLAAPDELTREAARTVLAQLTLQHLHDRPLTDAAGRVDVVMRVNYDIDRDGFASIAGMTVGELHDHLLRAPGDEVARTGRALTGVMAAAVAKLCDVHELIYIARKIVRPTRARTLLGAPGTLSSRMQPNHPTDDPRGITLLTLWGLSIGSGDAIFGVNPAIDTVGNVAALLRHLDGLRRRLEVPTQICVLAHVKTQLAALEAGAPVEILFQSLAGTEATLVSEFDCTIELLDAAYRTMAERGALAGTASQFTYFETGQGSELTYGKHEGTDMATLEALCYGLARRWDPFMVNNVTGFIGPETHLDDREMVVSNLQDHFMGKLLGLPMGMAPCFTLHAGTSLEGRRASRCTRGRRSRASRWQRRCSPRPARITTWMSRSAPIGCSRTSIPAATTSRRCASSTAAGRAPSTCDGRSLAGSSRSRAGRSCAGHGSATCARCAPPTRSSPSSSARRRSRRASAWRGRAPRAA
jgi:ethanolamine ammonia-lyase large subunit